MYGVFKNRGTILGVPVIRIIVCWTLYIGSPYFGKLPCQASGLRVGAMGCIGLGRVLGIGFGSWGLGLGVEAPKPKPPNPKPPTPKP